MSTQAATLHKTHDGSEPWFGFRSGLWTKEINVRPSVYEDLWQALTRRLRRGSPDLFAAEGARTAALP